MTKYLNIIIRISQKWINLYDIFFKRIYYYKEMINNRTKLLKKN